MVKTKQLFAGLALMTFGLGTAQADYTLNLMEGVTSISRDVYGLHMLVFWVCVVIGIAVFGTMFYSIYFHRKSRGHKASLFHESTKIEIIWTIIPTVILILLAIPATKVMLEMDDTKDSDMSIKVTGWQWKWEYEYLDSGVRFFSSLDEASNKARQLNSGIDPRTVPNYLLEVDKPLVVPINTKIRFLFTAADVIHSWWVPDLGWKKDTIPGYINEAWTSVDKPGTYRGQCTELCGRDHGFMPIVVIAMEKPDYEAWVVEQKQQAVANASAADKEWSAEDLIAKGESVYTNNCASCHMADGAGLAGTFPAITGSALVTGDMDAQVDLMLNGKGMMPAFGQMLDPVDFAAVSTFIRNGLGNSVGDSIQPATIKALQGAIPATEYDDDDD
ncbi:cytochrome c oxidase subunit II [Bathymodiolus japonicus methanotrophic gill symbiont]|uniref:cytochrome c oxidase subunit II n=1 Tax=Bathymodiolus japonicus methanotrophic gill symbiont TaxID=113269 RepID=UPI001B40AAEE|nr:cytochrome c oxidase subunit II [Bathymodiolus japonicus methanotrophic gill symbiont]GFO72002.1 cytochrome c oxidase subunit II [Bathymodiolus japonicus methanotrophic gill symbiont]